MATPASRTVPSSPNPSVQDSSHAKDWGSLRTGEPGSAFRGISRGRGGRGVPYRGGRGGGRPPSSPGQRGAKVHLDPVDTTPSPSEVPPSKKEPPVSRKAPVSNSSKSQPNGASQKAVNGPAERGARSKPGSRRPSRPVPALVIAPASPTPEGPQIGPPTPSRSTNRNRRRLQQQQQQGKGSTSTSKPPLPQAVKVQKSRSGSTPVSQIAVRKDIPPHLAAVHDAEIRHDIDALVERVRAVAMAENRPTTPGSHIDWAGDEDDSLPDLDDWGVTTTYMDTSNNGEQNLQISPILADTLKPLPEPQSEVGHEEEQEMESYNGYSDEAHSQEARGSSPQPFSGPVKEAIVVLSTVENASEQSVAEPAATESSSGFPQSEVKVPLHHSLPPKPVAAAESLHGRGQSICKPSNLPRKSALVVEGAPLTTKTESLSESIQALSTEGLAAMEKVSSTSSSARGLAASIHATKSSLPESQSAPTLLPSHPASATSRTHARSQTEGRPGSHQPQNAPANVASHRFSRSGASSPLGQHVFSHSRNHSTPPAAGVGVRPPQAARPVITCEAITRLARTIGGLGPAPRTQPIPVTKDSTIAS
ncbi:hypothetical protein PAXRUDRAFT_827315 [Paxillus rubicundulus Ve08.2h10]|uniref:Uncharacterized protein n=1 Tax=Paxillus rubicundulus Ve08.2h10 TaxID=930991 RepID=A0A0D0DCZ0_9AGAM|nr:hypothetical protein PAXRUDRAFT_827315 [Paxillus rubicundulus Ve08.2h10]